MVLTHFSQSKIDQVDENINKDIEELNDLIFKIHFVDKCSILNPVNKCIYKHLQNLQNFTMSKQHLQNIYKNIYKNLLCLNNKENLI